MGDSRFHLNVTLEVYGKKFYWKPSLNWTAEDGECDKRIVQWFVDCYSEAYSNFMSEQWERDAEQKAFAEEKAELERLVRLSGKYSTPCLWKREYILSNDVVYYYVGCKDNTIFAEKYGNYCPYCGGKIEVAE